MERLPDRPDSLRSQKSMHTDGRETDVPKLPGQVYTVHHIPLDRNSNRLRPLWLADSVRAGMVYRYVENTRDAARSRTPDNPQKRTTQKLTQLHKQSPTPSASTSSTFSSPSSRPNSTPLSSQTPTWKTACPQAPLPSPPKATRSSSPSCAACLNSNSGTQPLAPSALLSSAAGARSLTCLSSGRFWWCTG